jgi:hypothetical protein
VVAVAAGLSLGWSVLLFLVRWPALAEEARHAQAVALIFLWGIGPAVWFAVEWRIWKGEKGLAIGQQYARDFWIGAGAIVLTLAAITLDRARPEPMAIRYTILWTVVADLARALAWPLVTVISLVALRKPIGSFVAALGARATKLGAFNISIELGTAADPGRWSGPSLDSFTGQAAAVTQDSSGSLFRAIAETTSADYAVVNLVSGNAWLTSRLFVVASIIPRVRGLKRIVFVEGPDEQFLGMTTTDATRSAIARSWTWLEEAYLRAQLDIVTVKTVLQPDKEEIVLKPYLNISSVDGPVEPDAAGAIVREFLWKIQVRPPTPLPPAAVGAEWVSFVDYSEHASWLDSSIVRTLLGRNLQTASIVRDPRIDSQAATRTLLRHDAQFVPVTDVNGRFLRLIDRCDAMTQILREGL